MPGTAQRTISNSSRSEGQRCHSDREDPAQRTGTDAPRGRIPKDATQRERMARRMRTKSGRADYARRKAIVEPVFGQMKTRQNAKHLRLRGLTGAKGEWALHAICHNLRKLANATERDRYQAPDNPPDPYLTSSRRPRTVSDEHPPRLRHQSRPTAKNLLHDTDSDPRS